jgi:hypothetical protein
MITFTSSVNPLDVIELPKPKFGDTHTINWKRINRTSRGNDLILDVPDANWQPTFLHKYDFEYLKDSDKLKLKAFMSRHVGIPVIVEGVYDNETWTVIFLRPDAELAQVGRENRTITLDMQEVQ